MTSASEPDDKNEIRNLKEYFLIQDALHNLGNEVNISVFRKYRCKSNCEVCYIKHLWIGDEDFRAQVPSPGDASELDALRGMFDYFDGVATIDDLPWLKQSFPHLYDFYRRNCESIMLSSITDNAFPRHLKVIEELKFRAIYELTFSDTFVLSGPNTLDYILSGLNRVTARTPLLRLKLILGKERLSGKGKMDQLVQWAKDRGIAVYIHDDFRDLRNRRYIRKPSDEISEATHVLSMDAPEVANLGIIFNETIHLQSNHFYLTTTTATSARFRPFYQVQGGFNPSAFLVAMLEEKIAMYREFAAFARDSESSQARYFKETSQRVRVRPDFTFIPIFMLKRDGKFSQMLTSNHGFQLTPLGWLKGGEAAQVIPIVSYSAAG